MVTAKQELALKYIRDPKLYLETFCRITPKKGGTPIPFRLTPCQVDLFNALANHDKIVCLKCRQLGMSTAVIGWIYHNTVTTPGTLSVLVGYNSDLTSHFLGVIRGLWNSTPKEIRPRMAVDSKFAMSFPDINSKILVLASTPNVGRGYAIQNCLASEVAFWGNDAADKLTSLMAATHGKLIVESTPSEIGTTYHKLWVSEDSDWKHLEYTWPWGYTETEIKSIRRNLEAMSELDKFSREYELEFSSTGRSVFDRASLKKQRKHRLSVGDEITLRNGEKFRVSEDEDGLCTYRPPEPGRTYVFGADVAEGSSGGDYSTMLVLDRLSGEEVAFARIHVPPDTFGELLDKWGRLYNTGYMVVEVNGPGITTLLTLKKLMYPALYFRPARYETAGEQFSDKLGWRTTTVTRPIMIADIGKVLREESVAIHSKETQDELSVMIYDALGRPYSPSGFHDDTVFALGVALQGFNMMYTGSLDQLDLNNSNMPSFH